MFIYFYSKFCCSHPATLLQLREHVWFAMDVLVTVNLVHGLVVLFWSGVWDLLTRLIVPDKHLHLHLLCASVGLCCCLSLLLLDSCLVRIHSTVLRRHRWLQWVFEVLVNLMAAICSIMLWIGCWQILNDHVLLTYDWRAATFHTVGVSRVSIITSDLSRPDNSILLMIAVLGLGSDAVSQQPCVDTLRFGWRA